ncbi:hypothetical protein [Halobacterium sp. R2-5]|uniref:hypothetical protein n=1 Tax=Halobacterium sp. R2-5 TaxID=2715751 RepID=UPI00142091DA|nr:hypothetical protein [Halobacterium sp. R2-5]NIB99462.1 hypothetical protein [Halobacterium sp. R2-5]
MTPFDDETVAHVAAGSGVATEALREAAEDVQATIGDYPGLTVDGLVYEWRQAFRDDPLVERRPDAWVLSVPERVWVDVCERAEISEETAAALAALYATEVEGERDGVPLVLLRE